MKEIKLNEVLIYRVKRWKTFDIKKLCSVSGCFVLGKETDAGDFCFFHYMEKKSCSVPGCYDAVANANPFVDLCRNHYVIRDKLANDEYLKRSRESALYSGNSTLAVLEENAVGSVRDFKSSQYVKGKRKQKEEEQKRNEKTS